MVLGLRCGSLHHYSGGGHFFLNCDIYQHHFVFFTKMTIKIRRIYIPFRFMTVKGVPA